MRIKVEAVVLSSTSVKVHPEGTGAPKTGGLSPSAVPRQLSHQDPYGCRECSNFHNLCALPVSVP